MIPTIAIQLTVNGGMPADVAHKELQAIATTAGLVVAEILVADLDINEGALNITIGYVDRIETLGGDE